MAGLTRGSDSRGPSRHARRLRRFGRATLGLLGVSLLLTQAPLAWATHMAPGTISGNPTCAQAGGYGYQFSVKGPTTGLYVDAGSGFQVKLTVRSTALGPEVDFVGNLPTDAVLVKGGSGSSFYAYEPAVLADSGLHAPVDPLTGMYQGAGQKDLRFCFDAPTGTPAPSPTPPPTPTPTQAPPGATPGAQPTSPSSPAPPVTGATPSPTPSAAAGLQPPPVLPPSRPGGGSAVPPPGAPPPTAVEGEAQAAGQQSLTLLKPEAAAAVATAFSFPLLLMIAVVVYLIAQEWMDARDPKLRAAARRREDNLVPFRHEYEL